MELEILTPRTAEIPPPLEIPIPPTATTLKTLLIKRGQGVGTRIRVKTVGLAVHQIQRIRVRTPPTICSPQACQMRIINDE